jgi:hypothetical protein
MCFTTKNKEYVSWLSQTLGECQDKETRLWVLSEERQNIFDKLHSSFDDCISPSFFFEGALKTVGEDPIIQKNLIINLYLYDGCDKILPNVIKTASQLPFKIEISLFEQLKKHKKSLEVLGFCLMSELHCNYADIVDVVETTARKNYAVFTSIIDAIFINIKNGKYEHVETLLIHLIKAWSLFKLNNLQTPKSLLEATKILLHKMSEAITKDMFDIQYNIGVKLYELKNIIFPSNRCEFPLFFDQKFNAEIDNVLLQRIEEVKSAMDNLSNTVETKLSLNELLKHYRVHLLRSKDHSVFKSRLTKELSNYSKETVIQEVGLDTLKEGFETNDELINLIIQRKYIYEVLL